MQDKDEPTFEGSEEEKKKKKGVWREGERIWTLHSRTYDIICYPKL